jgi:hypothetical protein
LTDPRSIVPQIVIAPNSTFFSFDHSYQGGQPALLLSLTMFSGFGTRQGKNRLSVLWMFSRKPLLRGTMRDLHIFFHHLSCTNQSKTLPICIRGC